MNITKLVKQDIITSLKKNLNETNIEELISEVKEKANLNLNIKLIEKGYKLFESFINYNQEGKEQLVKGFGRTKYEALSNSFLNTIESLLEKEMFVDPIKDSLKIVMNNFTNKDQYPNVSMSKMNNNTNNNNNCNTTSNNNESLSINIDFDFDINKNKSNTKTKYKRYRKISNYKPNEIITNDHEESETQALVSMLTNDKQLLLCHEDDFSLFGDYTSIFDTEEFISFKNEYQEKTLIIYELEKMVVDMMQQIKKMADFIETESDSYPDYFKCPISWEKLENPVVSVEGHSYEKWAIDKWLKNQETSPITGLVLNDHTLISNYALKSAIDDYNKKTTKWKRVKQELFKYLTKSEYDLNDLKKYFVCKL